MIDAIFNYTFMQNALLAAILSSIVCGIIGTIIVEKKLVMMSGGIAHTSFGGIGFGYFIGIEPIIGAMVFSVLSALGITKIKRNTNTKSDTLIGIFWAVGMALGILFISFTPGYPPSMESYLFGDILTVTSMDIYIVLALDILVMFIIGSTFKYWRAYLFDDEFLNIAGINTVFMEYFIFVLIAMTVVVMIRIVGIILVISMLTVPPAIAKMYTNKLKNMMLLSVVLGMVFGICGLAFSYHFDISSGATIILVSATVYGISAILSKLKGK